MPGRHRLRLQADGGHRFVPAIWTHITTVNRVGRATGFEPGLFPKIAFTCIPLVNAFYPFYVQGKLNKYGRQQRMTGGSAQRMLTN